MNLPKEIINIIYKFNDENESILVKRVKGDWNISICYICNDILKDIFMTDYDYDDYIHYKRCITCNKNSRLFYREGLPRSIW